VVVIITNTDDFWPHLSCFFHKFCFLRDHLWIIALAKTISTSKKFINKFDNHNNINNNNNNLVEFNDYLITCTLNNTTAYRKAKQKILAEPKQYKQTESKHKTEKTKYDTIKRNINEVLRENPITLNNIQKLIKNVRDYRRNCLNEIVGFVKIWTSLHALSAAQTYPPNPEFLQVRGKRFWHY
jgi:hypothetical protein